MAAVFMLTQNKFYESFKFDFKHRLANHQR